MPDPYTKVDAEEVQKNLRERLGHDQVHVKPYGKSLLLQIEDAGELDTIARLTRINSRTYGAAFRTHTGRWEPLPDEGSRDEMLEIVLEEFGPYLTPENY